MTQSPALVLIAALAENGTIGRDGVLPWRLPEDLKRFRRLTLGKIVLMGRKTFSSLGKPLDGRENWVLTQNPEFAAPAGARVFGDLEAALAAAGERELLVIGGAQLYEQTLSRAARLELTRVHEQIEGDTRFPALCEDDWRETGREDHPADERHAHAYSFVTLIRR